MPALAAQSGTFQFIGRILRTGRVVGCSLDEEAMLVIGAGGPLPNAAPVEINDSPAEMPASIVSWRLASPAGAATHAFAALLPANAGAGLPATLRFGLPGTGRRHVFMPRTIQLAEAASALAEIAGCPLSEIVDPLMDVLAREPIGRQRFKALAALIRAANGSGGLIELLGEARDGEILLRGWAYDLAPGTCQAIVGGEKASHGECGIAVFSRQDVPEGAAGMVGLLRTDEPLEPTDVEGVIYRGRSRWRYAQVHETRLVSGTLETPDHIRAVLLQTRSSPQVLLRLRTAANSFEGSDTVSSLPLPVRMRVDSAYRIDGAGFLISGWLLDPDGHVQSVKLCSHRAEARLDQDWSRLDRADVTDAFIEEPLFRHCLDGGSHAHGFVAHVRLPVEEPARSLHLELTLQDSRRAFLPLNTTRLSARAAALRQIRAINPTNRSMPEIVDRQIVPLLCEAGRKPPEGKVLFDAGSFDEAAGRVPQSRAHVIRRRGNA
jgi:hypothetical protein